MPKVTQEVDNFFEAITPEQWKALPERIDDRRIAHLFNLTRNGHGSGFWDESLGKLGDQLTELAHSYGTSHLYENGDGTLSIGAA